jgi:protein-S-isoprenylcysteine O-methyltransferase Ste14
MEPDMTSATYAPTDPATLLKGAAITGLANAVINGAIQAFLMAGHGPVALSADAIGSGEHTVLGTAVLLATILAMILTAIGHLTLKGPKRPFLPDGLWLVVRHGLFAFGAVVAAAVLWQRFAGTVVVGVPVAVAVLALVAGLVAAAVHAMTILGATAPRR